MSTMQHTIELHEPEQHSEIETHHPTTRFYIAVGAILAVITLIEVWVYGVPELQAYLSYILIALSAAKFVMVVGFFMHLRFDNKLYTYMFSFGLFIAVAVVVALMALFSVVPIPGVPPAPGQPVTPTH